MKVSLSKRSIDNLITCHHELITIFTVAAIDSPIDFAIICGHRSKQDQEIAFEKGNTDLHFPNSKHNKLPSSAVDAIPYPVDWDDIPRFEMLCDHIEEVASQLKINLRCKIKLSNGVIDYPHYELVST